MAVHLIRMPARRSRRARWSRQLKIHWNSFRPTRLSSSEHVPSKENNMITFDETRQISNNGIWKQNPGVVQILGMCPTLAMTTTVVNGASLGIATALVMLLSGG